MRKLTPRQSEVLDLLFRGVTAAGIGAELKISANTVRKWCCEMYKAAGVTNDRQMVYYALCNDMLKIPGRRIVVDGGPDDGMVMVTAPGIDPALRFAPREALEAPPAQAPQSEVAKPAPMPFGFQVVFNNGCACLDIGGAMHNIGLAHAYVLQDLIEAGGEPVSNERLRFDYIGSGGSLDSVLSGINYQLTASNSAYRVAVTPESSRLEKRKGRT